MHRLATREHFHELLDPSRASLTLLRAADPIEDGVPVCTRELEKHFLSTRIGRQRDREVRRNLRTRLSGVRGPPSTIGLCPTNLVIT